MQIFDAHCDVLMKLFIDPSLDFTSESLQLSYPMLKPGSVQCFAVYIPETVHPGMRFMAALSMIELFHKKILSLPEMIFIRNGRDIEELKPDQIGAVLTLEGCDCIEGDLLKLSTLLRLGVTSCGLTWNYANALADGALEPRNAGLTILGKQAVEELNQHHAWTDLSHLSERSFWDALEYASYPAASHSNVYALCQHPRNLRDGQIQALFQKGGVIGVAFVPQFLNPSGEADIEDILRHIDYLLALGGEDQVGFGSDFDGIDHTVNQLSSYEGYCRLIERLENSYGKAVTEKLLFSNFRNYYARTVR